DDADEDEGDDEVHRRAGDRDRQPPPERLGAVRAFLVGGVNLIEVVHADDLHVGAGRYRLDAVLRLAALEGPDARTEPEEELRDLHARRLGGEVVAELVQEDHDDEGDDDEHHGEADLGAQDDDGNGKQGEPDVAGGDLALVGGLHALAVLRSTIDRVTSRARRSTSITLSTSESTVPSCRSRASSNTSAMASHGRFPLRKAPTATSLAALSQAGAEPPLRPAA